jgi:hypothetical protein
MRLAERELESAEPRRELYSDFPNVQSEPSWATLFANYPNSPLAAAAGLRLAQLELRGGRTAAARRVLALVDQRGRERRSVDGSDDSPESVEAGLKYDPAPYRTEARRLAELIELNRADPRFGDRPLIDLAGLDPRRSHYRDQLARLAQQYEAALLHDNLIVMWIGAATDLAERRLLYADFLERTPGGDARPEALLRLAEIELQLPEGPDGDARARAALRLRAIGKDHPGTVWAEDALRLLEVIARTADGGVQL